MRLKDIPDNTIFYDREIGTSVMHIKANGELFKRFGDTWVLITSKRKGYDGYVYLEDLRRR